MLAENYASFFENINKNTSIKDYERFFDENSYFKDPFHEVRGVEKIYGVFQKMYENLDEPKFKVLDIAQNKEVFYIEWEFNFYFKNDKEKQSFIGLSKVIHDEKKVMSHIDFWDAAENLYEKLPIISNIIRFVKKKIAT